MSDNVLEQMQEQEAKVIALSAKLHRWSLVLIDVVIGEYEQKLLDSDLPVEPEKGEDFWDEVR